VIGAVPAIALAFEKRCHVETQNRCAVLCLNMTPFFERKRGSELQPMVA